jgi:hypothetical protein
MWVGEGRVVCRPGDDPGELSPAAMWLGSR